MGSRSLFKIFYNILLTTSNIACRSVAGLAVVLCHSLLQFHTFHCTMVLCCGTAGVGTLLLRQPTLRHGHSQAHNRGAECWLCCNCAAELLRCVVLLLLIQNFNWLVNQLRVSQIPGGCTGTHHTLISSRAGGHSGALWGTLGHHHTAQRNYHLLLTVNLERELH